MTGSCADANVVCVTCLLDEAHDVPGCGRSGRGSSHREFVQFHKSADLPQPLAKLSLSRNGELQGAHRTLPERGAAPGEGRRAAEERAGGDGYPALLVGRSRSRA